MKKYVTIYKVAIILMIIVIATLCISYNYGISPVSKNDKNVESNVKKYEPYSALYAKDNGLYYYKVVFEYLTYLLKKKLTCYFEINPEHKDILTKLINNLWYKNLCKITYEFSNDYHGLTRYLKLTLEDEDYKRQWFLL